MQLPSAFAVWCGVVLCGPAFVTPCALHCCILCHGIEEGIHCMNRVQQQIAKASDFEHQRDAGGHAGNRGRNEEESSGADEESSITYSSHYYFVLNCHRLEDEE